MSYSEAAYFDGNHCQHCASRDEYLRLEGIIKRQIKLLRDRRSRRR